MSTDKLKKAMLRADREAASGPEAPQPAKAPADGLKRAMLRAEREAAAGSAPAQAPSASSVASRQSAVVGGPPPAPETPHGATPRLAQRAERSAPDELRSSSQSFVLDEGKGERATQNGTSSVPASQRPGVPTERPAAPLLPPSVPYPLQALGARLLSRTAGPQTIVVTSPAGGEGKTFTAARLAAAIAERSGAPTVLVDGAERSGSVLAHFGRNPSPAPDAAPPEQALLPVAGSSLRVLAAPTRNGTGAPLHPTLRSALSGVRELLPDCFVVIDAPSVLAGPEAVDVSELADAVLLVLKAGRTREKDLVRAIGILGPAPVVGLVYNEGSRQNGSS